VPECYSYINCDGADHLLPGVLGRPRASLVRSFATTVLAHPTGTWSPENSVIASISAGNGRKPQCFLMPPSPWVAELFSQSYVGCRARREPDPR